jgi:hypothetical protein
LRKQSLTLHGYESAKAALSGEISDFFGDIENHEIPMKDYMNT